METPYIQKERMISFTNIVIGSGLLWFLLYILGPLVDEYDDYMLSSVAETKQHAFILFAVFTTVSLIVGIIAGLIIKKKPLLHGTIIGLISLAVSLLTKVPVKSFNLWTILMYVMSVFLPVVIGTLVGISIKKIKEKKSWLFMLIGLVFMPVYYFGMPLLISKAAEALIQRELGWKEEMVDKQPVSSVESPPTDLRAPERDILGLRPENARLVVRSYINYYFTARGGAQDLLLRILPDYENKISIVYEQTPLRRADGPTIIDFDFDDPEFMASEGAKCASEQGKFLAYHRMMVTKDPSTDLTKDLLKIAAKKAGLVEKDFSECMENHLYRDMVEKQRRAYEQRKGHVYGDATLVYFDGENKGDLWYIRSEEELRKYFDRLFNPPKQLTYEEQIIAMANEKCPENVYDKVERDYNDSWLVFQDTAFYAECSYDRKTKILIDNKTTDPPVSCAPGFSSELKKQEYNFINGCLFRGEESVFEKRIHGMIISGEFGEDRTGGKFKDTFGEEVKEWFRFQDENKLYIYFVGGAGCGGCIFNGPFLVVDLETGAIEKQSAELPYAYDLLLAPDNKKAIEFEYRGYAYKDNCANTQTCSVKLYIYDFVKTKRTALAYEVADEYAVLACGMGCYTIENSITWTDENHVKIQLYRRDQNGEVQDPYIPEGKPTVIDIRTLAPLPE